MVRRETKRIGVIVLAALLLCTAGTKAAMKRALDQTIDEAAREAATKLNETKLDGVTNIAVLPLWGECDPELRKYIDGAIQSQIVGGPYKVMERNTQVLNQLLGEIEWSNLQEDILNPGTVQRFGKIEGCDAIVYGTIRECASYPEAGRTVTRLTLKLGIVQTGEVKWSSNEIKSVRIMADAAPPQRDMNPALVRAISSLAAKATEGLRGKNVNVAGVALFPLLGHDQDGYITDVLLAELTKAGCNPVPVSWLAWREYLEANSRYTENLQLMQAFAKEKGYKVFLGGTVNECRVLERKYKACARATLNLVNADTGEVMWSPGEIQGAAWLDGREALVLAVSDPIVWVLGLVVVLLVIWRACARFVKAATRPR